MRDAAERLLQDLRWRLSPAGKKYRPDPRTLKSWGAAEIPSPVPFLLWMGWFVSSFFIAANMRMPEETALFLVPASWVAMGFVIRRIIQHINTKNITAAYGRILRVNERFLLIEYTRYIRRKIRLAERDPVLGGPEEVRRLKQTHRKLRQILEKGQHADNTTPVRSILGDEADFAESLIEVYDRTEEEYDPLAELDARLPEDIRSRLDEFEQEYGREEQGRRLEKQ
ncbi:MAG: hypothetical protein H7A35_12565 [Planctomycetales bacterium]|nr:hypothetical protein [bacterium]UNM07680.1 MAG: hypothetical protein H7A35_12565 [Planctomycetales bacterium]